MDGVGCAPGWSQPAAARCFRVGNRSSHLIPFRGRWAAEVSGPNLSTSVEDLAASALVCVMCRMMVAGWRRPHASSRCEGSCGGTLLVAWLSFSTHQDNSRSGAAWRKSPLGPQMGLGSAAHAWRPCRPAENERPADERDGAQRLQFLRSIRCVLASRTAWCTGTAQGCFIAEEMTSQLLL
jgi:hypothetical protein